MLRPLLIAYIFFCVLIFYELEINSQFAIIAYSQLEPDLRYFVPMLSPLGARCVYMFSPLGARCVYMCTYM